jgi:hypothetical protein
MLIKEGSLNFRKAYETHQTAPDFSHEDTLELRFFMFVLSGSKLASFMVLGLKLALISA